jgi:hypothetical protein
MEVGKIKIESADGVEGVLIWCGGDRYVFRVYSQAPYDFVDYDIHHSDMCVVIRDPDAYFYTSDQGTSVDHSPATLGLKT